MTRVLMVVIGPPIVVHLVVVGVIMDVFMLMPVNQVTVTVLVAVYMSMLMFMFVPDGYR